MQHAGSSAKPPLPTVLPVTPVAYIFGGDQGAVTTRMGNFYFPHSITPVQSIYFAPPSLPQPCLRDVPQREAKCKANEKLKMNVDDEEKEEVPVVEKIKITKKAPPPASKRGRKPRFTPSPRAQPVVAAKPVYKTDYEEFPGGKNRPTLQFFCLFAC